VVRFAAALLAGLVLAAAAPVAAAPADHPVAHAACRSATIEGQHKCIAAGQYCRHTRRANRDYHRYGYHCGKRDRRGSYHLVNQ
jgi:uncharacterized membrane protein